MTIDLALVTDTDADNPVEGDLRVDGVEFALVEGGDAIAQEVRVRLRWWRGEWFLDTARGVPYLQELLGRGVSEATIRSVLRREILAVPGVARIPLIEITTDRAARYSTIDIDIVTADGETVTLNGVPIGVG